MYKNTTSCGRLLCYGLLLQLPFSLAAQDILWEQSYGGRQAEYLLDAVPTADYGFILAGSSLSGKSGNKSQPNIGDLDYWVWKMNEGGDLDWQKSYGGTGTDLLQSIRLTGDGGFILAGTSNSPKSLQKKEDSRGGDDFWIVKLDAKGGEQWQRTIGGNGQEKLQSVYPTSDGGYILGGTSASSKSAEKKENSFGNLDYWLVKLDHEGEIDWQKTYGGLYLDELRSIEQTADGGYIVGGYSNSPATGNKSDKNTGVGNFWVLKLDKDGETEWQRTIGGDKDDQLYVAHQTYDGNYLIAGSSNSSPTNGKTASNINGTDFWLVKVDTDGNTIWQETYDIGRVDMLTSVVENKDHTLLIGGFAKTEIIGTDKKKDDTEINDYVVIKTDEKGNEWWRKSVGSDGEDILIKAIETRDGGYLLAGTSNPITAAGKAKRKKGAKTAPTSIKNNGQNKQVQNAVNNVNDGVKELTNEANDAFNQEAAKITKGINDAMGSGKDSPLQYGLNEQKNPLKSPISLGGGNGQGSGLGDLMPGQDQQPSMPASREKARNFGNKDFWVVKLRDKDKPTKPKATIEAIPNPANDYTNVIIGYEYQNGTATIVDLAGHQLDSFSISGRTVPVNMSRYPDGIYIVNIKTEKGSEGVKVMKKGN
jgi:Secretion system C-terminal sorting domain